MYNNFKMKKEAKFKCLHLKFVINRKGSTNLWKNVIARGELKKRLKEIRKRSNKMKEWNSLNKNRVICFICLFKIEFFQLMCMASLSRIVVRVNACL